MQPTDGMDGLTTEESARRRLVHGDNALPSRERRTWVGTIAEVVREPMVLLLIGAMAIYVVFGDVVEATALGVSVIAIVAIAIAQERRTERALDALRELASPRARVRRDGAWRDVDARELVPGDIVELGEGGRVPADALVRAGSPLSADEAVLTGESVPVIHAPDPEATAMPAPGEPGPGVFAGTTIVAGTAVAEIVRTGATTEVGKIGVALGTIELARAPVHREIGRLVRAIAIVALGLSAVLALVHVALGHGVLAALLAAITLAMSLLPEELPLVLAVFLSLGARRIARHRVLARRAAAIETLGAITVLCVDKTGTLTQNRMAIARVITDEREVEIAADATALPEDVHATLEFGLLACPQHAVDPTDGAFGALAARALETTEHVHPRWAWVREYPLSPGLLAVTHAWRAEPTSARVVVATKGAPEAILDLCHASTDVRARWRARADAMARAGLRVLGVARAEHAGPLADDPHVYAFELVGLVGLADPLRAETAATIATCRRAGIRVVMITGDHPATARAIAAQAGLRHERVIAGAELDALADGALAEALATTDVIARATPAHKLRIVRALRARGDVVGMTGDGVNDAPALEAADVGLAMGRGTDVAREAAGLVILDDTLAAIVDAIGTGRTIYDNLRKVARYLLAVHVPIVGLALVPVLAGWPVLLGPVHVVFLELVIDPTCSILFEVEPPAPDVMTRAPRPRDEPLLARGRIAGALVLGLAALVGPLATLVLGHAVFAWPAAETHALAFAALLAADVALVFAALERTVGAGPRNAAVPWMVGAVAACGAIAVAVPGVRDVFGFAPTAAPALLAALAGGAGPVVAAGLIRRARSPRDRGSRPA